MSASGGGMCGIFCFLDGSAPLGWKGRAVVQPGNGAIFAECCSFRHDERNMEVSSRGPRRAVEPVRRINPAGSAGDSVAQSALFAPSYSEIWLPILAQIKKINGFVGIVSRETSSRPPALCLSSNARLDFCRRPQNLFCACFSCTSDDQARLAPCPGSSGLNLSQPAGIAPFTDCKTARPTPTPFPSNPTENPTQNSPRPPTIPHS